MIPFVKRPRGTYRLGAFLGKEPRDFRTDPAAGTRYNCGFPI